MTQERILITGGAGYIGSVLFPELLKKGYKVRIFDNLRYNSNALIFQNIPNPNFEFIKGDVRDKKAVEEAMKDVDVVIHLAAIVGLPACKQNPEMAEEVNIGGTKNVLETRGKIPIIFASTISNYGRVKNPDVPCNEETPLSPTETYSLTKTKAEEMVKASGNYIVFRFATAFGLSPRLRLDLLINEFVYKAVKERQLIVYEKAFKRPFVHIRDIAKGIIFAIENRGKMLNNVYNLGSNQANLTKEQVALLIKSKLQEDFILHFTEGKGQDDQRNFFVDSSKLEKLGFKPDVSVEQGVEELIKGVKLLEIKNPYTNL